MTKELTLDDIDQLIDLAPQPEYIYIGASGLKIIREFIEEGKRIDAIFSRQGLLDIYG